MTALAPCSRLWRRSPWQLAAAAARPAGQLGHEGRWYTDEDGRVRILHGLNVVAKRAPYLPSAIGIGDDDAAFMARQGFNTIRLGVIYTAVEPRPGVYDDRYLAGIARTVRIFRRHGIYSLLDFHQDQYNERFEGQGFPDWAVLDDGLPAEPKFGFPLNYYLMPALQRTYDNFWANRRGPGGVGVQTRYAAAWRHVAARFRARRGVMGYDLMNEPFAGSAHRACLSAGRLPAVRARAAVGLLAADAPGNPKRRSLQPRPLRAHDQLRVPRHRTDLPPAARGPRRRVLVAPVLPQGAEPGRRAGDRRLPGLRATARSAAPRRRPAATAHRSCSASSAPPPTSG